MDIVLVVVKKYAPVSAFVYGPFESKEKAIEWKKINCSGFRCYISRIMQPDEQ